MNINKNNFIAWAEEKFGDIIVSGDEIKINDPWWQNESGLPDKEYKCWVNLNKGCYHAFKSNKGGSIIEFVMSRASCDYDEAMEILGGEESIIQVEKKLEDFFVKKPEVKADTKIRTGTLPPKTVLISAFPEKPACRWAKEYLEGRNLSTNGLMVGLEGTYRERIVIPAYGPSGDLYLGPKKEDFGGIGKGDVLWVANYPPTGTKIYLTEGEFDAMSLLRCGYHAAACGGKALSDKQISILSPYYIALAFDADKAGKDVYEISQTLFSKLSHFLNGKPRVTIVRPPAECKDWNKFLVDYGEEYIRSWIDAYEKNCTEDTLTSMKFRDL